MKPLDFIILFLCLVTAIVITINIHDDRTPEEALKPWLRDYQIELDNDSMYIWDGTREVGSAAWSNGLIDSILLNDNR